MTQAENSSRMLLGTRLQQLRVARGVSQEEIARATGCSTRSLSDYESGRSSPPATRLLALAVFFQVSADYLLGRVDHPQGLDPGSFLVDLEAVGVDGETWYAKVPRRYRIVDFDELKRIERQGKA